MWIQVKRVLPKGVWFYVGIHLIKRIEVRWILIQYDFHLIRLSVFSARGFGMRVVGGKTGADGRLFAYIVWTVPGGPAEKAGLLQGDKVCCVKTFTT